MMNWKGFGKGCVLNKVPSWNLPQGTEESYAGLDTVICRINAGWMVSMAGNTAWCAFTAVKIHYKVVLVLN
jgi:hypothetical protein